MAFRVESSSDSEDEEGLEAGKHDIIVLHEKAGNQSMFRSRKHHPMFPYHEEKVKDEYSWLCVYFYLYPNPESGFSISPL